MKIQIINKIRMFYLLTLLLMFKIFLQMITSFDLPIQYVEILSWAPEYSLFYIKSLTGVLGFLSLSYCIFNPWSRFLRISTFISLLLSIAFISSYGKIVHGFYGITLSSFSLIFMPSKKDVKVKSKLIQIFFITQFCSILCYSMAGLWKLRYIPQVISNDGIEGLLNSLGNTIAFEHLTYSLPISSISQFFLDNYQLTGVLFLLLISLQSLSPLIILSKKLHFYFGCTIVLFHILSELIVGIPFRQQMYLMILFFIFSPFNKYSFKHPTTK